MIVVKTPLRISLFGGGTDFPNYFQENVGQVLTTTIDKYTHVILNKRPFDNKIRLGYSKTELVDRVDQLEHELARESIQKFNLSGIELTTISDVPGGTGLATSSSILVGMLNALATYNRTQFDYMNLADWAIDIEVKSLKKPIGYQDQIAVARGGLQNIYFSQEFIHTSNGYRFADMNISKETFCGLEDSLVMFYLGGNRYSSDILEEQNKNVEKNNSTLRAMCDLCTEAVGVLEQGKVYSMGTLLDESWKLKKSLASAISNPFIDKVYKEGLDRGALGGKLLGAGGKGFMLFQIIPRDQKQFIKYMCEKFFISHFPFRFENYGSRVVFNDM